MNELLINIISIVLTSLATFLVSKFTVWLNTKIKNNKVRAILLGATDVVTDVVKATYQTYVEGLKAGGIFDRDSQLKALEMAKIKAIDSMNEETKSYITKNFGDLEKWVCDKIEAVLYDLKQ